MIFLFFFLIPTLYAMDFCDPTPKTPTSTPLLLHSLSQIDPLAVCNDGTPGAYYFSPSTSQKFRNHFIIHLPGGSQCYDQPSCEQRWNTLPKYMSSSKFNKTCYKTGILDNSEKITPLYAFNKIMIAYCSSDGYMGDAGASNDTWGWHMRGQRLVYATIKALVLNGNLTENSKILISGGSAGARGVMVLLDFLKDFLPKGAKIVGFLDSPFYLDIIPYNSKFEGFQYQEQQKIRFFNVKNVISEECANLYGNNNTWKCLYGQYRVPLIRTPYFMVASQYDAYQLGYNVGKYPPFNGSELDYVNNFGKITQEMLKNLEKSKENMAYFSWTCFNHDVSESLGFIGYTLSSGVNQRDALEEYLDYIGFLPKIDSFFRRIRDFWVENNSWIDDCEGFGCGGCDGQNW